MRPQPRVRAGGESLDEELLEEGGELEGGVALEAVPGPLDRDDPAGGLAATELRRRALR